MSELGPVGLGLFLDLSESNLRSLLGGSGLGHHGLGLFLNLSEITLRSFLSSSGLGHLGFGLLSNDGNPVFRSTNSLLVLPLKTLASHLHSLDLGLQSSDLLILRVPGLFGQGASNVSLLEGTAHPG